MRKPGSLSFSIVGALLLLGSAAIAQNAGGRDGGGGGGGSAGGAGGRDVSSSDVSHAAVARGNDRIPAPPRRGGSKVSGGKPCASHLPGEEGGTDGDSPTNCRPL